MMTKFSFTLLAASLLSTTAVTADTFEITVTNLLEDELLAPIVITGAHNDHVWFEGTYVTAAGESQILTGNPGFVVAEIGDDPVVVVRGTEGEPGYLVGPGSTVSVTLETEATALRVLSMVAPTRLEDTYVTGVLDVNAGRRFSFALDRYDIGYDEKTRMRVKTDEAVARVEIVRQIPGE